MKRTFPFPAYPNGWFQVSWSDELPEGKVVPLEYFGQSLVAFRDSQGRPAVLDAYCPHLGAHLGVGGRVEGDRVVCPFHSWKFDCSGKCVDVPYATKVPAKAQLRAWPTVEVNGLVLVWHHAEGAPPAFDVPRLDEIGSDDWTPYVKKEWKIRTRNQEMAENAVDSAHFHYVHGATNMPKSQAEVRGHVLHVISTTGMSTPRGGVDGTVESMSHGFGFSTVRFRGLVETLLVSSTTPIDKEQVHHRFSFTIRKLPDKDVTKGVGSAFVREVTRQLEQDIPIWENKRYHDRPMLCDGDGPIGVFRKWAKQFYSMPAEAAATESAQ